MYVELKLHENNPNEANYQKNVRFVVAVLLPALSKHRHVRQVTTKQRPPPKKKLKKSSQTIKSCKTSPCETVRAGLNRRVHQSGNVKPAAIGTGTWVEHRDKHQLPKTFYVDRAASFVGQNTRVK